MVKLIVKFGSNSRPDEVSMEENEPVRDGLSRFYKDRLKAYSIDNFILRPQESENLPHCINGDINLGVPAKYLDTYSFQLTRVRNTFECRKFKQDGNEDVNFFVVDTSGSHAVFKPSKAFFKHNNISVPYLKGEKLIEILYHDGRFDRDKLLTMIAINTVSKASIKIMTIPFNVDDKTTLQFQEVNESSMNKAEITKREEIINNIKMYSGRAFQSNELEQDIENQGDAASSGKETIQEEAGEKLLYSLILRSADQYESEQAEVKGPGRKQKVYHPDEKGYLENRIKQAEKLFCNVIKSHANADLLHHITTFRSSVCAIIDEKDTQILMGTGFYYDAGLIITNCHVIRKYIEEHMKISPFRITENLDLSEINSGAVACFYSTFNAQISPEEEFKRQSKCFRLGKIRAFQEDLMFDQYNLDYAIIELKSVPEDAKFESPQFETETRKELRPIDVHVLGWKRETGERVVDVSCCVLTPANRKEDCTTDSDGRALVVIYEPARVNYRSDLYHGASGSPVFNRNGKIIAMHTKGFHNKVKSSPEFSYVQATMMLSILQHANANFPALRSKLPRLPEVTNYPNVIP